MLDQPPDVVYTAIEVHWPDLALLKRIRIGASGGQGYVVLFAHVEDETTPQETFYGDAGAVPHLQRYPHETPTLNHTVQLAGRQVWTLPEEVACRALILYHAPRFDGEEYTIRLVEPELRNPLPAGYVEQTGS